MPSARTADLLTSLLTGHSRRVSAELAGSPHTEVHFGSQGPLAGSTCPWARLLHSLTNILYIRATDLSIWSTRSIKGDVITSVSDFTTFWKRLAEQFKSNSLVVFDLQNEPHDMDNTVLFNLLQGAIKGIRSVGATSQYIFVEGNAWTAAGSWVSSGNGANLVNLEDPNDKLVYEVHSYLDGDASGTSETCASPSIGQERVEVFTAWLKENGKKGFLGEFAGGANSVCKEAIDGMLTYLEENKSVWMGWCWWAAGARWASSLLRDPPTAIT
ncbi:hypothetical protein JCM5296_003605 [Sporobolomyces johnsonii]